MSPERAMAGLGPAGSYGFVSLDGAFFNPPWWLYKDLLLVMNNYTIPQRIPTTWLVMPQLFPLGDYKPAILSPLQCAKYLHH